MLNQYPSGYSPFRPAGIVGSKEIWIYFNAPKITGKSGKVHEFDFGFYLESEDNFLVLGKKYSHEVRNGLAALTYFNAHSDDVGAARKVVFCEMEIPQEVKLLANALKIEILYTISEMNSFLASSLRESKHQKNERVDVSSILSLEKEKRMERSKKKYRDRTKLIQEVLRSASAEEGATLNNIVFKCNLNYNSARKIVDDLISRELIGTAQDENDKTIYRVTGDGSRLIEKLRYIDGVNSNE